MRLVLTTLKTLTDVPEPNLDAAPTGSLPAISTVPIVSGLNHTLLMADILHFGPGPAPAPAPVQPVSPALALIHNGSRCNNPVAPEQTLQTNLTQ